MEAGMVQLTIALEENDQEAIKILLDLSSKARSGSGGRTWTRDELYER